MRLIACTLMLLGLSVGQSAAPSQSSTLAAKRILREKAVIFRYGPVNLKGDIEALSVVKWTPPRIDSDVGKCTPISEMVIMRPTGSDWQVIFEARRGGRMRNPSGYVGLDYLDDSPMTSIV